MLVLMMMMTAWNDKLTQCGDGQGGESSSERDRPHYHTWRRLGSSCLFLNVCPLLSDLCSLAAAKLYLSCRAIDWWLTQGVSCKSQAVHRVFGAANLRSLINWQRVQSVLRFNELAGNSMPAVTATTLHCDYPTYLPACLALFCTLLSYSFAALLRQNKTFANANLGHCVGLQHKFESRKHTPPPPYPWTYPRLTWPTTFVVMCKYFPFN